MHWWSIGRAAHNGPLLRLQIRMTTPDTRHDNDGRRWKLFDFHFACCRSCVRARLQRPKNKLHNEILFNGKIHNKWTTQRNAQCIQTVHITNIIICIMGRAMAMNKLKINKKHSLSENINKCKFVRHSASTLFSVFFFWRYE